MRLDLIKWTISSSTTYTAPRKKRPVDGQLRIAELDGTAKLTCQHDLLLGFEM